MKKIRLNKKITILLLTGILSVNIISCASATGNLKSKKYTDRIIDTGDIYNIGDGDVNYHICYDSETNIVYIVSPNSHNSGISVMSDNDGKIMTINRYKEIN